MVEGCGTVKPEVVAHTLSPAALMMEALSMWPVPTRLQGNILAGAREAGRIRRRVWPAADRAVVRTWSQRMLGHEQLASVMARTATTREGGDGRRGDGFSQCQAAFLTLPRHGGYGMVCRSQEWCEGERK